MTRKPVNIDANYISVATQLSCLGTVRCAGNISCSNRSQIILGTFSVTPHPDAIILCADGQQKMRIGKDGVRFDCGFSLFSSPDIVVRNISNDPLMSTASNSQIATTDAIRTYIDNKLLGARFDTVRMRELRPLDDKVTIEGATVLGGNVTMSGPLYYSCASIEGTQEGATLRISTAIVFVCAYSAGCFVDVVNPEFDRAQVIAPMTGTHTRQIIRFVNETPGTPCSLRFDCGCAQLVNSLKLAHDTYLDNFHTRWVSTGIHDVLFPMRAMPIFPGLRANCVDINVQGTLALMGNWRDGGERGCAYLTQRYGASWALASEKIVGSRSTETMHQGIACALSGDSRVIVSANETQIWVFACISRQSGAELPFRTQEFACVTSTISPIISAALNANGEVLVIASDNAIAIYDIIIGVSCTLRTTNYALCAPIYLTICSTAIVAKMSEENKIARAMIADLVPTIIADYAGAPICSSCDGTTCLSGYSASIHLRTTCHTTPDKMNAIITHEGHEYARILMELPITAHTVSRDGSFAILCLSDGSIKCMY